MFSTRFILGSLCLAFLTGDALAKDSPQAGTSATVINVSTAHSSLTLCVGSDRRLYQLGYGPKTAKVAPPMNSPSRDNEFLPASGNGFVLEPALEATHADGNTSTDLIHVKHGTSALDTNITLTRIEMQDRYYPFFVDVYLKAYVKEDVIEQWTTIRNEESGIVNLDRFASSSPLIGAKEKDYWLTQFHGDWAREAEISQEHLTQGIKILDSKLGVRAAQYRFPSFILALKGPAREESGEVFGGSLEWSGSYQLAFDVDWNDHLRVLAGINPFASQYHLPPHQTVQTPPMLWTWSAHGKGQVSRNLHAWARQYGVRNGNEPRPVFLNNWEATGFDFNEKKLVSLLDEAKDLGVDLFLLDDGWFGDKFPRNKDDAGLGDWDVNTNKLPHGLGFLAGAAVKRGLRFGIWLEPEMLNPKSELYEKHPDWAIGQPHRDPETSRNQLVLDLSNPAVKEFVWNTIDGVLGRNPDITYVKWDANRYVTQPGSSWLKPGEQSHLLIDYNFALYDLMARMAEKYPNVMAMLCSGGGGRADYGALKYFDSFWPSDQTDPLKRIFIQWGYSHIFPACAIRAEVTRSGHRPLKFALDVAMSDALAFDMDPAKMTSAGKQAIRQAIQLYGKDLRAVVSQGDLYRLESPYDGKRSCLDYVSPDKSKAVLFVYQLKASPGAAKPGRMDARRQWMARPRPAQAVKLAGLNPHRKYLVREVNLAGGASSQMPADGQTIKGSTLMRDGLVPPCQNEFDSAVIELEAK